MKEIIASTIMGMFTPIHLEEDEICLFNKAEMTNIYIPTKNIQAIYFTEEYTPEYLFDEYGEYTYRDRANERYAVTER